MGEVAAVAGILSFVRNAAVGSGEDIQFNRTLSGSSADNFIYTRPSGGLREITSWANPVVGATVCNYGEGSRTNAQCAIVRNTNGMITDRDDGTVYTQLRVVDRAITEGGDSGGPWFINNAARGVHSGLWDGRSAFEIAQAVSSVGVSIKTN
ncbi:chymotrypsin family serine protease [Microlunatus parietis]|uniref:Trypsin n=1 Tax=Microlunatus parietis TaxID=682979 RepID=A0A7Y9LEY3_9ACTN|nr:hypothetical protein [Microlunatus parietis]NYE75497.1 hypothetical protein [Microlunatus parietis]